MHHGTIIIISINEHLVHVSRESLLNYIKRMANKRPLFIRIPGEEVLNPSRPLNNDYLFITGWRK